MRKYLIHDVLSKRVQRSSHLRNTHFQHLLQDDYRPRLHRLMSNNPPVFCLKNIQRYLALSTPSWHEETAGINILNPPYHTALESTEDSDYSIGYLDHLVYPLTHFADGSIWMEAPASHENHSTNTRRQNIAPSRGWLIFREENESSTRLVFVEFNKLASRRIEMSSIITMPLDNHNFISFSGGHDGSLTMHCDEPMSRLTPEMGAESERLHLPLFALNILQTQNGFSMPIEEQGRRQLASRIGIQNESGSYFFEVGPKMKHFVRGHIRVYTARQQTPLTVWVPPHTRGNRRPMLPDQHRRRSLQPSVGGSANALQCTEDG